MQNIIAIIFDFDDTLAPDSTSGFLETLGLDVGSFWKHEVNPMLEQGWDPVPAYLYRMLELARDGKAEITKARLAQWGAQVPLYRGVKSLFSSLQKFVEAEQLDIALEFYLVSSGIGEILRASSIADNFHDIWACEFHYADTGVIEFPKRIVSFTDKTRYLFHIAKGIVGERYEGKPFEVNRKVPADQLRVPMNQMIFVGDGHTDVPCFSLVRNAGGTAIGVYDAERQDRWGRAWGFIEDNRVSNLVPADYGQKSALVNSLKMAVGGIARNIAIRRSTYQG
ncbi:MAG: haloacid dehalogenase-like hydrolase [Bdellovibrionales bacterium]|nr:haloacid dehalogenase-like hydrolase [Bdellovibrionales bacterium]